jgi:DNA-binding PadR family transcriptional regulator
MQVAVSPLLCQWVSVLPNRGVLSCMQTPISLILNVILEGCYIMRKTEKAFLTRNADYLILRCLVENGSKHGYGVMMDIKAKWGVYLGPSTIYPKLHELADEGLLSAEWDTTSSKQARKVYGMTDAGIKECHRLEMLIQNLLLNGTLKSLNVIDSIATL